MTLATARSSESGEPGAAAIATAIDSADSASSGSDATSAAVSGSGSSAIPSTATGRTSSKPGSTVTPGGSDGGASSEAVGDGNEGDWVPAVLGAGVAVADAGGVADPGGWVGEVD